MAGIVLFNPELQRLSENVNAVIHQVNVTVVVDNGSKNVGEIDEFCRQWPQIKLIRNSENKGIATALNQIMQYAYDNNYEWVLSLDQDSICEIDLVKNYLQYIGCGKIGMLTCHINDRNFQFEKENEALASPEVVDFCITSGCLLRTEAWLNVGRYDDKLFIDKVDTDMCWLLCENGWKIVKIPYIGLLHEIGHRTKRKKVFNKEVVVFNHSPFRCYYIVRNGIYCAAKHRRYRNTKGMEKSSWHRILLCLIFEENKLKKLYAGIKGLIDGYKMVKESNFE